MRKIVVMLSLLLILFGCSTKLQEVDGKVAGAITITLLDYVGKKPLSFDTLTTKINWVQEGLIKQQALMDELLPTLTVKGQLSDYEPSKDTILVKYDDTQTLYISPTNGQMVFETTNNGKPLHLLLEGDASKIQLVIDYMKKNLLH